MLLLLIKGKASDCVLNDVDSFAAPWQYIVNTKSLILKKFTKKDTCSTCLLKSVLIMCAFIQWSPFQWFAGQMPVCTYVNNLRNRPIPSAPPHCVLTKHNPLRNQKSDKIRSDICARMLGARGRVVQNDIGVAHMFLLTRAPWAEPNGSVFSVLLHVVLGTSLLLKSFHYCM